MNPCRQFRAIRGAERAAGPDTASWNKTLMQKFGTFSPGSEISTLPGTELWPREPSRFEKTLDLHPGFCLLYRWFLLSHVTWRAALTKLWCCWSLDVWIDRRHAQIDTFPTFVFIFPPEVRNIDVGLCVASFSLFLWTKQTFIWINWGRSVDIGPWILCQNLSLAPLNGEL